MDKNSKIYVSGHNGLVGSAIVRQLKKEGYINIITFDRNTLNLLDKKQIDFYFSIVQPEYIFAAAAKVGGINANNTLTGSFFYENITIQTNLIDAAHKFGVKKLLFLGSSCIYPKECKIPIKENYLLTGTLEDTNRSYAIAKIAGLEMCKSYNKQYNTNFISAMPCNLYGINDNFNLDEAHVLPALIHKFYLAKQHNLKNVDIWGDGTPLREFLFADDAANAMIFLMKNYNNTQHINIGFGEDISIKELALLIKDIIGYTCDIKWINDKPNGTIRKLLDISNIKNLGWLPTTSLETGIIQTYNWFKNNYETIKK